jgi:hypothetical protein
VFCTCCPAPRSTIHASKLVIALPFILVMPVMSLSCAQAVFKPLIKLEADYDKAMKEANAQA